MLDDLLGPLPPYLDRRNGTSRAHIRIGNLAGGS
jgi:hypothetical protein